MRILIAEDDPSIAAALVFALRNLNNYAVDKVHDGELADRAIRQDVFDLVVLDLGLPRMDGFELLRRLRLRQSSLPVLVISGRCTEEDKVRALDLGADDYMVKPFGVRELEARVRALLRRGTWGPVNLVDRGGLCFDTGARTATLFGRPLPLSARECAVLELLMRDFGRIVRKEKLMEHVYSYDEVHGDNAIEVFVHRLRKKLASAPVTVCTHHGIGYRLDYRETPQ